MGIEIEVLIAYGFALVLLYITGYILYKLFSKPLKWLGVLLFNGILGGIMLFLINMVGGYFDFYMAVNPITVLVAGFLGVPGIVLMIILKNIL
ncbi:pro-sigmaK processing inhibitor BofA family protein [Irregularibacter muris]|uniref:Pro-sigmaK processing inhibitor BofA family protein n=1 Tax=Irregularibacter muris TaxID=1796619 RepID=A0AAE3HJQ0_9FIRM|nr:pro-sigmaK processing inhibitor BofA family protein [Irregularibacter muris]